MIICDTARKRLNALLDDECSSGETARLTMHLEQCAACRTEYEQLAEVRQTADAWQVEGGDVWSALQTQLDTPELAAVLQELQQLRAEVRALRAEVAMLRGQTTGKANAGSRPPSPLLPYTPPTTRELHMV